MMDEKNPLHTCPVPPPGNGRALNKRGRPATGNITQFGLQPKSIIGQMLAEMKTKNIADADDNDEPIIQNDQLQDFVDSDKTADHVCQKWSHRSYRVKEHKKNTASNQQFLCDFPNCSYSCKLSSNLIKHKRVHTNEKPYLCDRCSFRTNFVNSLKAHRRTHTAEKPYQCHHCDYKCNSSSNLKKHCHLRHKV